MWTYDEDFLDLIQDNWHYPLHHDDSITGMAHLWLKLKRIKYKLNRWNHNVFKNHFSNISEWENKVMALDEET